MYKYQRIKDLREDNDKTQKEVADFLGMFVQQYSRYETGQREIPVHHLIALANYYNVTVDYLVSLRNFV